MTTGIGKQNRRNRMKLIDADELKKKKKHSKEFAENIVSVAEIDWQPTVEAIPIEWIEKYVESCPGMFKKDMRWIEIMVVWWKEEQEKENDS